MSNKNVRKNVKIDLNDLRQHPWTKQEVASKKEINIEMKRRLKTLI